MGASNNDKHFSLLRNGINYGYNIFMTLTQNGPSVVKTLPSQFTNVHNKLKRLSLTSIFHPSLMLANKAKVCPCMEDLKGASLGLALALLAIIRLA